MMQLSSNDPAAGIPAAGNPAAAGRITLTLTINGRLRTADAVPATASLLTALREHFALPGTKNACEQGECGSCTVYLDGETVCACLVAAGQAAGREVRTVEGLAEEGVPDAVQRAFIECGAVQCGFCTPGLVVAVHDLLHRTLSSSRDDDGSAGVGGGNQGHGGNQEHGGDQERGAPSEAAIREALAGNLCRCTGYEKIIEAVRRAAAELRAARESARSDSAAVAR